MQNLNRIFLAIMFLFILMVIINLCLAEGSLLFQGEINANGVNIRSDSRVSSEIICVLNQGEPVEVVLELYDWYKIRLPKSAPSFIKKTLVGAIEPKNSADKQIKIAKVLKENVNIRLRPNESAPILGKVNKDEIINILQGVGDWYKIEPVNNSFGWIHKKFVNKLSLKAKEAVVQQPSKENRPEDKSITLEGTIKSSGWPGKRFSLVTATNSAFLLKGKKKELNSLTDRKVKVTGKLDATDTQIIDIEKIEAIN